MSRVLIVESDPMVGAVLRDRLQAGGHETRLLLDSRRAVAAATEQPVELLILEVSQPGAVGLGLLKTLRGRPDTLALPILVLSNSADSADRVTALRAGADDYVTRPCDLEELELRVERLAGSRAERAPVLQGDLGSFPVWELMQYLANARKSGELVLLGHSGGGRVNLAGGKVVAATWEEVSGREALLAVLGLKRGSFRFVSGEPSPGAATGTTLDINETLMEAAWLEDELEKRRPHLPPTGAPLSLGPAASAEPASDPDLAMLPLREVLALVREHPGLRVFDLLKRLPRAPQAVRLGAACLVERKALALPDNPMVGVFPTTAEIASSELLEMAVTEFLTAARRAGFGTTALPFLVLVEPGLWFQPLDLLRSFPGYRANEALRGFVDRLQLLQGGSATFSTEVGKLSLHIVMLDAGARARAEAIATVSAGVMLWLDKADDLDLIGDIVKRIEAVRAEAVGVVVATPAAQVRLARTLKGTRRWRMTAHAPQTLLGLFGLLQGVGTT